MNITVTRRIGSSLLALAFILAPITPALDAVSSSRFVAVKVAEADAISYGTISGVVHFASTSVAVKDVTINLYLKDSNTLTSSVVTDENGIFAFSVPQDLNYTVVISPAKGFAIPKGASTSTEITSLKNSFSSIGYEIEKLPYIKMFGGSEITIQKDSKFVDPGVVFQKDDGTIVSGYAIESNGKVDTSRVGKYVITYGIDKEATNGYPILDAERIVNVADKNVGLTVVAPVQNVTLTTKPSTSNTSCVYLNSYLGKSFSNDKLEVLKLQAFLFFREGFTNVKATGVYDNATEVAVRNFQDKYYKDILTPWGSNDNTGEVRITTLKKINDIYCGVNTALTNAQVSTFLSYKNSVGTHPKVAVDVKEEPIVVAVEPSFTNKIAAWWNGVKSSLVAAFPTFKDDKKDNASTSVATGTPESVNKVSSSTENLAFAKEAKGSRFSIFATIISAILGFAAFVLAFYIYRRTRGPALVTVEEEVEEVTHLKVESDK